MTQPPPPYGGDPNNPYGQQPQYAPPPGPDPYGAAGYDQPPTYTPPPGPDPYYGGQIPYGAAQYGGAVQYGGAGVPAQGTNNSLALTSMILGIAGLVLMWFCGVGILPAIAALITGFIGRSQINDSGGMQGGSGMALTGIITGAVAVGLSLMFLVIWLVTGALGALFNNG
ncbi:MAG: DUF4190 domain-containing protein [Acidimicrobiaceae bacterium]|nr:DUF4190 domain-containing protein [Acidimicrobiaceae bacterium]